MRGSWLPAPEEPDEATDAIVRDVVDASYKVRQSLGAGLFERVYRVVLAEELRRRGHKVAEEVVRNLEYEGRIFEHAYRMDLLVDDKVVVELKATSGDHPFFTAQVLTYLRLTRLRVGLVVNFHAVPFSSGIRRLVHTPS